MVNDPLRAPHGAANLGGAALARGAQPNWEIADILEYNAATHTAVVKTHSGRALRNVPQIKTGPGEYEHYRIGTTVIISYDLGFPAVLGCISLSSGKSDTRTPPSLTGVESIGDDNPLQPTQGTGSYKPASAPTDMTGGDWARVGTLGNHVAVMEGGVTLVGSPTAQLRSLGLSGVMQLLAQQTLTHTDFGEWKTVNDQGKTSFILRAGSNQNTQTGYGEENWTIKVDLGATGDLFNFEISESTGKTLFKIHVDPNGHVQIFGTAASTCPLGGTPKPRPSRTWVATARPTSRAPRFST